MSWTYGGDPAASPRDRVRFLTGDTDAAAPLATDEEIAWALQQAGSTTAAAAAVCRAAAARLARQVDKSVGDLSLAYAQQHAHYLALAERLDRQAGGDAVALHAGGLERTPAFRLGLHDLPGGEG